MKVAVLCEYSGIVRDAFIKRGQDAMSCDILPTESPGPHYQGDVFDFLYSYGYKYFDLIIAHPPCTYMSLSGNRWYAKSEKRDEAIKWTLRLWAEMKFHGWRCVLENPASVIWKYIPRTQYIHPWQFGHGETKKTGLAIVGLPELKPTNIVEGREPRIWKMSPSDDRGKERSRTYHGIADAMAEQWG